MLNAFDVATSRVFGNVSNKQFFTLYKTDINNGNIFKMLPGVGNSLVLGVDNAAPYDGAYYSDQSTWSLVPIPPSGSQKGRINNMLLAQLITLWFNLQTSAPVGTISLTEDTLVTKAQTRCGSGIPTGDAQKFGLPHSVVIYLNGGNGYSADVNGLFVLANDVLGGVNSSVSASDVQSAIAAVNNSFNGCRVLVGTLPYVSAPLTTRIRTTITETAFPKFSVSAYPNPAATIFNLKVSSPDADRVLVYVTDALGRRIETRMIKANETIQLGQGYRPGIYIVQIVQGQQYRQIKLMKLND
jgi:hypothetical protein